MIPTSLTSSSPPTACLGSIGNQMNNSPTISGSAKASNGAGGTVASTSQGQGNNSAFLGIASLILEGRALADDEYATIQTSRYELKTSFSSGNSAECGRQSPKPSTSRAAFGDNLSGSISSSSFSIDLVNYLGRKASNSPESTSSSFLRDYYNSSSSESASSSVDSNHSRWSQKLSQLRQESPSAHHQAMPARQKVAIECPRGSDAEYVALAINTDHHHHHQHHHQNHFGINEDRKGGDFEIIRRMSINQMNFYNSPNSMVGGGGTAGSGCGGDGGSSENFMCSLQSLASNTCLRVGNPSLLATTSPPKYFNNRQISSSSTARCITPQQQQQQQQQLDYSNGSNNSSGSSGGVGGVSINTWYNSSSSHLSKGGSKSSGNNKDYLMRKSNSSSPQTLNTKTINSSTPNHNPHSNIFGRSNTSPATATTTTTTIQSSLSTATANRNQTYPQQGPHCDQFLKKMGLAKSDASDTEEHYCDMSYVNITCTRWRAYCIKMENILARGEPICIEVYLGPVGHKILLEQWIITQREKQPPPTMTLPSLCSAIRSQLYFSQISAWCDLIKKSDKSIHETGRVIYTTPATTSAAGDLATTTNNAMITASTTSTHHPTAMSSLSTTSPTSVGGCSSGGVVVGVGCGKRRPSSPRLNIFYRIKQYDSTACFNSKPNVHNFPNVNISENCCVSVCLKSLPRITGGIPKVGITATQQQQQQQAQQSQQNISTSGLSPTAMAASPPVNSATPTSLAAKNKIAASDTSNAAHAAVAVNVAVDANAITTNANKLTILKMNCDNNLKEQQQQQKPFTASSSSSSCSILSSKKNSKQSLIEDNSDCNRGLEQDLQNVDFECYEERNIDMSAGGDNKIILCDSGMIDRAASIGDCDSSNSSLSTNNFGNLSHRERQLLKYRKRMLKRDKKQQLRKTNDNISANNQMQNNEIESCNNNNNNNNNKMEQGEDDGDGDAEANANAFAYDNDGNNSDTAKHSGERKYNVNNLEKGQRQQLPNNHKNSIPCTNQLQLQLQQQHQYHSVKMISTGTQTITNTCTSCGSEKSMICLKCHPFKISSDDNNVTTATTTTAATATAGATTTVLDLSYNNEEIMDAETSSVSSLNASDIIHTPRNKAELLLQAIQRTPKSNKKHKYKQSKDSNQMAAIQQQQKQKQQEQQQQQQLQNSPTTTNNISSNSPHNNTNSTHASGNNFSHNNSNRNSSRSRSRSNNTSRSTSRSSVTNGVVVNNNSSSSSSSNNSNNMMVGCQVCKRQKTQHNFNQSSNEELPSDDNNSVANSSLNSSCGSEISVAKISNQNKSSTDNDKAADDDNDDGDNEKEGGKNPTSDCVDNVSFPIDMGYENKVAEMPAAKSCDNFNESEIMEEEYFDSSTKLTPHIDRCSLNVRTSSYHAQAPISRLAAATNDAAKIQYQSRACSDQQPLDDKKENSSVVEGTAMMAQFKTPTPSEQNENANKNKIQQPLQPHKHTPKPNLLHIACNFNSKTNEEQMSTTFIHNNITNNNSNNNNNNNSNSNNNNNTPTTHNPLLLRRSLPKVNLTPIFCNPNSMMTNVTSSPIPIGNGIDIGIGNGNGNANVCNGSLNGLTINSADATTAAEAPPTFSFESPSGSSAPSITVQKSNSAPTLPNSPSLSPRFVKASAIYKRRSRHLSERSDRSSLGSDEQFSDEDIDSGMYSPFASSPVKLKTRLAAVFGRNPLLGNLEECLLQRRLVPKIEVMGFKLLLGASGGFCPTQLTIPAAAYFYELKGETLSTPYLCEIRLPRKGYTVPRCGTVQATLLNPMGTVVRMFVIPYDMRDMPTLHQTFIRQRILADTVVQTENAYNQNGVEKELNDDVQQDRATTTVNMKTKHQMQQQLQPEREDRQPTIQQQRSPQCNNENQLGHFISTENMKSLRYSIHLRFQTSRTGRLMLHTDIRLLISRRTDCDTAAAHAKGVLEAPNELITNTVMPTNPKYSARQDQTTSKI